MDEPPPLDGTELLDVLGSAGLDTDDAERVQVCDTDEYAWIVQVADDECFAAWQTARSLVEITGRWPIITSELWAESGYDYSIDYCRLFDRRASADGFDLAPRAILAGAEPLDVEAVLGGWESEFPFKGLDDVAYVTDFVAQRVDGGPALAEVAERLGQHWTNDDLYTCLHRWEVDAGVPVTPWRGRPGWYDPAGEWPVLVLLPAAAPWVVPAYLNEYDDQRPHPYVRTAVFRAWAQEFGIEPVVQWGTMHNLLVRHPPTNLPAAFRVARQIWKLWPSDIQFPNLAAHDLVGAERWFLHNHP